MTARDARANRRLGVLLALSLGACAPSACSVHEHRVGAGPSGIGQASERQFYVFFGLFQLNEVDVQRMATDVSSYAINTERSFIDILLTPILLPFTVTSRTVTVYR